MPFAAALSTQPDPARALDEVCAHTLEHFAGPPDLVLLFFSMHHAEAAERLAGTAQERLGARCLLGCCGEAIVGNDREIEQEPALSLWLGRWSGRVELESFHLMLEETFDGYSLLGWPDRIETVDAPGSILLLLGDPFSFPTDAFLNRVNETYPGLRVVGGMASGGRGPGQSRLLLGDRVLKEGAVGVLLSGSLKVRSIVSQGCRPVGRHMVITRAQENIIAELGGKTPLAQLQQLWQELSPQEQELFQQGLHVGRVINEYQGEFQRGDFLVRNILGLDRETGALAITDRIRVGQTVQFHVRDGETADEDLHALLQMDLTAHDKRPQGALLFTCNGRGTRLFAEPHHDAHTIQQEVGNIPLAGLFAAGELGPIGGQNFIHGFTASVVLFE
ncbi:MAG: FIST C-terminal domain-containing protein [Planctomycetes bacterium]|nr:FIST C-terminal domain-containing protein [Planctomycetota bacterium]